MSTDKKVNISATEIEPLFIRPLPFNLAGVVFADSSRDYKKLWVTLDAPYSFGKGDLCGDVRIDEKLVKGNIGPGSRVWVDLEMTEAGRPHAIRVGAKPRKLDIA